MKQELKTLSGFILLSILFAGCQKKDSIPIEKKSEPKEIILDENTTFLLNGKDRITYAEYRKNKELARILSDEENIILDYYGDNYIFDNDTLLVSWVANSEETEKNAQILPMLDLIDSLQNYAISRGIIDDSLATVNYSDSLNEFDGSDTLDYRGPITWPFKSTLYDGYNYTGAEYHLTLFSIRPSLGWFNARTSSLADYFLFLKYNILCSKTWFRGRKLWYWSWKQIPDMSAVNFDNVAKSKL